MALGLRLSGLRLGFVVLGLRFRALGLRFGVKVF